MRVAINGLGRVGRLVLRRMLKSERVAVVAINDIISPDHLAYLLRYDSTHGPIDARVTVQGDEIKIDDRAIQVLSIKEPEQLPWKGLGIDFVIESSGRFTSREGAERHLKAGAKRVIITAPAKGEVPTFVIGVNHTQYSPKTDTIVSNASCTTNCLALVTKVLLDHFGIEVGLMSTIHALTASQSTVDGVSRKDWRGGRGALQNIIPASTGASQAVGLCLPEVKGKLTGMAFRVPIADVSVVDLTVSLSRSTTYDEICERMKEASLGPMQGLLHYTEDEVVSSDFIGSSYSGIFDARAGMGSDRFYKLIAWYDNEMGYAARVVDLTEFMAIENFNS